MILLVGRKAICQFLGGISWTTVKKWTKERGLPVVMETNERPTVLKGDVDEWQRQRLLKEKGFDSRENVQHKVYFIQAESGGLIKIGVTHSLRKRFNMLQNSCPIPLKVLHSIDGGEQKESELHEKFSAGRKHGEWFEPSDDLLAFIDSLEREDDD